MPLIHWVTRCRQCVSYSFLFLLYQKNRYRRYVTGSNPMFKPSLIHNLFGRIRPRFRILP